MTPSKVKPPYRPKLTVACSDEFFEEVNDDAAKYGLSPSDYIRIALIKAKKEGITLDSETMILAKKAKEWSPPPPSKKK